MKLFQNKFFIICLCVAVVLCAVPTTFSAMGFPLLARNIVNTITLPVRALVGAFGNAFDGFTGYFQSVDFLQSENERLESENQILSSENARLSFLESENERLKSYLGIKTEHPDFLLEEAAVLSREGTNLASVLTLNRGTFHGVDLNMAVITPDGVVGCVTEAGFNWCRVTPITEPASSVGAYIPRSGACGIVSGDFSLKSEQLCKLSYVEDGSDILIGDVVCSSGTGSVYPPDLAIGTVTGIELDPLSRTVTATVKPLVDASALNRVLIVKSWQNTEG